MEENQNILDNIETLAAIDKNGMLKLVDKMPDMMPEGWAAAEKVEIKKPENISNIVISGMGGSAISGDIAASVVRDKAKVPIFVNRNYNCPSFVGKNTLFLALSYSGNTEETLASFKDALAKGANIISISSGGELKELSRKNKIPFIEIPKGLPPRSALGYILPPVLYIIYRSFGIASVKEDFENAVKLMKQLQRKRGITTALRENEVKQLAVKLNGKIPVIIATDGTSAAAGLRWKTQLNENSKETVVYSLFSELNHNDMVNFSFLRPGQHNYALVILRDNGDLERMKKRIEITKSLISGYVGGITDVASVGTSSLERLLSLIQFGDYLSVYLGILRGIDPTPVDIIDKLKKEMQR